MYCDHFHLREKPFQLTTDPRYLWVGPRQRRVLSALSEGIRRGRTPLWLLGDFGTGKTTVLNAFQRSLGRNVVVARLQDSGGGLQAFFLDVAAAFQLDGPVKSEAAFLAAMDIFGEWLCSLRLEAVLMIDEAQFMPPEMASVVSRLADMEWRGSRPLHLILAGQRGAEGLVRWGRAGIFRRRTPKSIRLQPLGRRSTEAYIRHRLHTAGVDQLLFTRDAVAEVHRLTGGFPRQINILCDFALLHGFQEGATDIDGRCVRSCVVRFQVDEILASSTLDLSPAPGGKRGSGGSAYADLLRTVARTVSLF